MQTFIEGPAGKIQLLVEMPEGEARGVAMVSHPQPLLGGSPRHLVPHTTARKLLAQDWVVVRPSFRGVDGSDGEYADGVGEAEDAVIIARSLRSQYPALPLALVGFSFGAHVYARAACLLESEASVEAIVLMGLPVGVVPGGREYEAQPIPERTFLLHGQDDEMAPLPQLLEWGRARHHPVTVFPGTDHFFKGCLQPALDSVCAHLDRVALPVSEV